MSGKFLLRHLSFDTVHVNSSRHVEIYYVTTDVLIICLCLLYCLSEWLDNFEMVDLVNLVVTFSFVMILFNCQFSYLHVITGLGSYFSLSNAEVLPSSG